MCLRNKAMNATDRDRELALTIIYQYTMNPGHTPRRTVKAFKGPIWRQSTLMLHLHDNDEIMC